MADIESIIESLATRFRASSASSVSYEMRDSLGCMSSRPSSPAFGWPVRYKLNCENGLKGVWDGYKTREEFVTMHLR